MAGAPQQSRADFNALPAPANYVPGLGRGATGFTTRSDIGPARIGPDVTNDPAAVPPPVENEEEAEVDDSKFDEFMGNDSGMLAAGAFGEYDEDDREADEIWDSIDQAMDLRRRDRRERRLKEEIEKFRSENPKITEQFADLKRKLAEVTDEEWDGIPDIGDYTIRKEPRFQSFVPVPDTLLAKAVAEKEMASNIQPGLETPMMGEASTTDLTAVGEGRGTVIKLKLDTMADSVSGQTVVDPKGYLTDLKSVKITSDAEISDIKKARLLLKSVIQTNQKHAPGWIAAARLEEMAARKTVQQGCEMCPSNEDVWLEAARLHPPEKSKAILARGVSNNPASVKLWMQASKLELEDDAKARVLRKALERIPNSVRLWKAAVELADEDDARLLLSRAVECCPQHVELWLALAKLETYENAKKVLNKARQAIPTDTSIWVTAAKLEEAQGNLKMVYKIISRGIESLRDNGVVIDRYTTAVGVSPWTSQVAVCRDWWIKEAENAERASPALLTTCSAIVELVLAIAVEEEDRLTVWMADADESERRGSIETAKAMLRHTISVFPKHQEVWRAAAQLERTHGTRKKLDELLLEAVKHCPNEQVLWLMAAKEKWLAADVPAARQILASAFESNPNSEDIYLAAFKLEFENNEPERAKAILQKALDTTAVHCPRVWMKAALVERELGNIDSERSFVKEGIQKFPSFAKFWMMMGQLEARVKSMEIAGNAYKAGLKQCPDSIPLWIAAAKLEEEDGQVLVARSILEQARKKNPRVPELWLSAVRIERRSEHGREAESLLAKGLQECPKSGLLLSELIRMAPRAQRKSKCVEALKRSENDPHVIAAVAELFLFDRKIEKARSWLNRCVTLDPDIGDHWALLYRLECYHGNGASQESVLQKCALAQPHHGDRWTSISKAQENAHMPVATILRKVAEHFETTPVP